MSANRFQSAKSKRQRWSRNAILAKERLRIERHLSPQAESPIPVAVPKIKPAKFAVKISIERTDGERIQFTCHRIGGKIFHHGNLVAPKSFFRRIGEIAEIFSQP